MEKWNISESEETESGSAEARRQREVRGKWRGDGEKGQKARERETRRTNHKTGRNAHSKSSRSGMN